MGDLAYNRFTEAGLQEIAKMMEKNSTLAIVDLRKNSGGDGENSAACEAIQLKCRQNKEKLEKSWEEARKADTEARQAAYLAEFKRNQLAKKKREEEEEAKKKRKTVMTSVMLLCGVFLAMIVF